jgi:uncharacterized membrane protein (DUF485 family)
MSVTHSSREAAAAYEVVYASREFRTLRRRFGSFVVPVTVLFLGWYFLYVIVAVAAPGFMRIRVAGEVNVGLCFGALEFVSTFVVTIVYSRWARRHFDPLSDRLKQRLERRR